ncbi:MAG: hypothetical protein P8R54_16800 [Myxococcota bacterium]|nr:hypothetical protein [Myxococcota bacterium]
MHRAVPHLALIALTAAACSSKRGGDTAPEDATAPDATFPEAADLVARLAFEVPERPFDLAAAPDGRIFCTAQAGGKVYAWDPATDDRDEVYALSDVTALAFQGDELFMTFSDNGVTGGLYQLDGSEPVELATQDDSGVLMRRPHDLISDARGGFLIADSSAGRVFHVTSDGAVTSLAAGSAAPLALLLTSDTLTIGGDDGIWSMSWPGGSPSLIDSRAGLGLLSVDGIPWAANASEDLFIIGGGQLGADDAARPGSLATSNGVVYFADQVGQGVWAVTP